MTNDALKFKCGIPGVAFNTHRLNDFEVMPGNEEAYRAACDYLMVDSNLKMLANKAKNTLNSHYFLTLCGEPGRGKTRLALGVALHQLLKRHSPVQYWQVEELLGALRRNFSNNLGATFERILARTKSVDLLILDDLGAHQTTEWATAKLDEIIDHRYMNQMRTVFTTNVSPRSLPPRIASRLHEGIIVVLTSGDYRALKAKRRAEAKSQRLSEKVITPSDATTLKKKQL